EVGGSSVARHIGVAGGVHSNAEAIFLVRTAQVGRVDQCRARRIELRHEAIAAATVGPLIRAGRGREVGGTSAARHVGVAGGDHGNAEDMVLVRTAQVGGIDQGGARLV